MRLTVRGDMWRHELRDGEAKKNLWKNWCRTRDIFPWEKFNTSPSACIVGLIKETPDAERKTLWFSRERAIWPKMALTSRCRGGGGENLSVELTNEDEGANGSNFEPLSDSCGESDMEGLDLSLFEPQVDAASWCDSRIHAGTLHILVHYCGKLCLHGCATSFRFPSEIFRQTDLWSGDYGLLIRKMLLEKYFFF